MKWIELKDGDLVNLEKLAKARMREIKAMLDYAPTSCN